MASSKDAEEGWHNPYKLKTGGHVVAETIRLLIKQGTEVIRREAVINLALHRATMERVEIKDPDDRIERVLRKLTSLGILKRRGRDKYVATESA